MVHIINEYLLSISFRKNLNEPTFYVKCLNSKILIVSLYVDDLLLTGSNIMYVEEFKQDMMKVFEMTDFGEMAFFLKMEVKHKRNFCQPKEICQREFEEVPNGKL